MYLLHRYTKKCYSYFRIGEVTMLSSKLIKEAALAAGADACGIAPISRMKGAPDEMNPMFLFPEAKKYDWLCIPYSTWCSKRY